MLITVIDIQYLLQKNILNYTKHSVFTIPKGAHKKGT